MYVCTVCICKKFKKCAQPQHFEQSQTVDVDRIRARIDIDKVRHTLPTFDNMPHGMLREEFFSTKIYVAYCMNVW